MRYTQTTFVFVLQPCSEKRNAVSVCGRFPYLQGTAVRYRVLTVVLRIAAYWFFQNGEMRSQESNYMYSSFTKSTIKNQNTQLTEKSVGITIRIFLITQLKNHNTQLTKKSVCITQFTKISYLELCVKLIAVFRYMYYKDVSTF